MRNEFILGEKFGEYSGRKAKLLISEEAIHDRVKELGKKITKDYHGSSPIIIGVLNGCILFMSDLFRELDMDSEIDFIKISSYNNDVKTSGTVRLLKDISCDIFGRDVLIVEDIIDSGLSIKFLKKRMEECGTKSVKIATLLIKEHTKVDFPIDYVGFTIPEKFVIGYGLDLAQKLRNLKSIYALQ